MSNFKIKAKDGNARAGVLRTAHGEVNTPTFMPVGTQGSVKALSPDDLIGAKSQIILGNTYHLYLRPGNKLIKKMGGLHKFMGWDGPVLTDSGGFQAFSLGAAIEHGVKKIQNSKSKSQNYNSKIKKEKGEERVENTMSVKRSFLRKVGNDIVSDIYRKKPEEREKSRENGRGGREVPVQKSEVGSRKSDKDKMTFSKITENGIIFRSHLDGSTHLLSPQKSMEVQLNLGSDIVLCLDELLSPLHNKEYVKKSLERTHRWELEGKKYFTRHSKKSVNPSPILFGILQGVYDKNIREREAGWIAKQGFDGISIGGSFGTSKYWTGSDPEGSDPQIKWVAAKAINDTFEWVVALLPQDLPRHGLGIGEVRNLFESVERGIDMFDCVSPTRRARNGSLYISPKNGGTSHNMFVLSIQRSQFKDDKKSIDPGCGCYTCRNFSRGYLRHLFASGEILYHRLASIHNVYFINNLMEKIREAIHDKQLVKLKKSYEIDVG